MAWVKGTVSGEVMLDGRIVAVTRDLQVMDTSRPPDREIAIKEGLDVDALRRVHEERPSGPFEHTAYFGGATAMLVPFGALALLDGRLMALLLEKYYGYMRADGVEPVFPEQVAIMHVRNTGAPVRQCDAEPSGGMAETVDLLVEQVSEMVEMGVYRDDGWAGFMLSGELKAHQECFDGEQSATWQMVKRDFPRCYGIHLELLSVGRDQFNGRVGIITAGPVGDFSFTVVAKLHLQDTGWKFCDLEEHKGTPIRRRMVAIAPRPGRSPIVFKFNNKGMLDERGHHFVLDGENRELAVTHIGRAVLEALGWME